MRKPPLEAQLLLSKEKTGNTNMCSIYQIIPCTCSWWRLRGRHGIITKSHRKLPCVLLETLRIGCSQKKQPEKTRSFPKASPWNPTGPYTKGSDGGVSYTSGSPKAMASNGTGHVHLFIWKLVTQLCSICETPSIGAHFCRHIILPDPWESSRSSSYHLFHFSSHHPLQSRGPTV